MNKDGRRTPRAPTWLLPYAGLMTALFALFVVLYGASRVELNGLRAKIAAPAPTATPTQAVPRDGETGISKEPVLNELRTALERVIHDVTSLEDFSSVVTLIAEGKGMWIRVLPRDLFPEGSAVPAKRYAPLLREIGRTLLQFNRDARVEGHVAASEVGAIRLGLDPWGLSSMRAGAVLKVWTGELHFPAKKLSLSGYGTTRPLGDPSVPDRRLDILVP